MSDTPTVIDGIKVNVTEDDFDDIEVLELIGTLDDKPANVIELMKVVFGEKKYAEIKEALRGDDGKCKTSDVMDWLNKVMNKVGAKN